MRRGHQDVVKLLLKYGADVNAMSRKSGMTPLHLAAAKGLYGVVQILLENKAEVDVQNSKGDIPLHLAVINDHFDVVQIFLERGVNIDVKTCDNFTSLHIAAEKGYEKVVELLLQRKASISIKSDHGATSLHLAAKYGHISITQLLLNNEDDIDANDKNHLTPLRLAAQHGHVGVVEFLLNKGANINYTDKNGFTPLHAASIGGHASIAMLLLQNGANVNAKNSDGYIPLLLALNTGHSKIINLLLADPNINVGCAKVSSAKKKEDKEKFCQKCVQGHKLFNKVKEAEEEKDEGKLDTLLKEVKELLKTENKYGFKPSVNYSPDGSDGNTTIEIAIRAGGRLLDASYDHVKKDKDTEISRRLKQAKEENQPQSNLINPSNTYHDVAQARSCV